MASLIKWEPLGGFLSLRDAMDRLFEDSFVRTGGLPGAVSSGGLAVDIYQTPESVIITTGIPGVKPEDVEITITGNVLTILGETKVEQKVEEEHYLRQERRYGSFKRSIALPETADAEQASANYEHGVLTLTIPKKAESKPKTIKVEAKSS
jgi:HSP20 family protein